MMKGTTFIEEPLKNIKCDLGIFLDVYPLDNISDDEEELKKQAKAACSGASFLFSDMLRSRYFLIRELRLR